MKVRVVGKMSGENVELIWHDGELSGDELVARFVRDQATLMEGRSIGVAPLWTTTTDHLSDHRSFLELCRQVIEVISVETEGEPEPEDLPEGSVS